MQYFGFDRPSFGIKTFGFGANFDPLELFTGGKQGAWYDPSDKSTLFQDVAGTIPVTAHGDPVGLMKDKSGNGNHATQSVSASRPIYKTDGVLHWLQADGVDDRLTIPNSKSTFKFTHSGSGVSILVAVESLARDSYSIFIGTTISSTSQIGIIIAAADRFSQSENQSIIANIARGVPSSYAAIASLAGMAISNTRYTVGFTYKNIGSNSDLTLRKNNLEVRTARTTSPPSNADSTLDLAIFGNAAVGDARARIYGVVIIDEVLSKETLDITNHYLSIKAGVTL